MVDAMGWVVCSDQEPFYSGLAMPRLDCIAVNAKSGAFWHPLFRRGCLAAYTNLMINRWSDLRFR